MNISYNWLKEYVNFDILGIERPHLYAKPLRGCTKPA